MPRANKTAYFTISRRLEASSRTVRVAQRNPVLKSSPQKVHTQEIPEINKIYNICSFATYFVLIFLPEAVIPKYKQL